MKHDIPLQTELSLILDNLPQAVLIVDAEHKIHYANATAESLLQVSQTFLSKHPLEMFLPQDCAIFDILGRAVAKRGPVNDYQIEISNARAGTNLTVDCHACPDCRDAGTIAAGVAGTQSGGPDRAAIKPSRCRAFGYRSVCDAGA